MKFLASKKLFILASLMFAVPITAAAQDIATVRRAVVSTDTAPVGFSIETGRAQSETIFLEIRRLDNSGSFVGIFYQDNNGEPSPAAVTGQITIVRGRPPATTTGNAVRISFTVSFSSSPLTPGGSTIIVREITYDGALRLARGSSPVTIAGTYTYHNSSADRIGGGRRNSPAPGPFPFCSPLTPTPPIPR